MTTTLVKADPFTATLATLQADWPERFTLEVDEHVFRDVGSMARAGAISSAMEGMKAAAVDMGYRVDVRHDMAAYRWVYRFTRRPGVTRPPAPPKPVASLPPGPKELDEFLDANPS